MLEIARLIGSGTTAEEIEGGSAAPTKRADPSPLVLTVTQRQIDQLEPSQRALITPMVNAIKEAVKKVDQESSSKPTSKR